MQQNDVARVVETSLGVFFRTIDHMMSVPVNCLAGVAIDISCFGVY